MPSYEWSCFACGHPNQAGVDTCATCYCPSQASRDAMVKYREHHLARGGVLLPGAGKLPEEGEHDILKIATRLFLSLFAMFVSVFGTSN